jgi:anti-sigma B factor antagonist
VAVTGVADEPDQLSWVNGVPVIRPADEVDATNAASLRAAIQSATPAGGETVVVDMSETAFCDSTGLNVLVRAHKRLEEGGGQLRLVAREATLLRIFQVTGMDSMFAMFGSLAEALAAPRVPAGS